MHLGWSLAYNRHSLALVASPPAAREQQVCANVSCRPVIKVRGAVLEGSAIIVSCESTGADDITPLLIRDAP